jgi:ribosomal protein S18 acetylase RimI-like enzyme
MLIQSIPGVWHESWRDDVLERGIAAADGLAFVWEEWPQIVGFICAHDVGFHGHVSLLVVAERARGRGIEKQLVERVQNELAERGCLLLPTADVWE